MAVEYGDFDIAIERVAEAYRIRVLASPAGEARSDFSLPFSPLELENFLLRMARPRTGVRRLESPETEAARTFGTRLFDAVFAGEVASQWRRSLDTMEREGRGLRLRIRLDEAPELHALPWEYLYSTSDDRFVALSTWTPIVRYLSLDQPAGPLRVEPPLRLLAMVSSPSDYPPLDVESEWSRLDESLADLVAAGSIEVTRLERATLRELQRALRRTDYHVFHFIGHGGFDVGADDGLLMLETEEGRAREVPGRDVGTILDDSRTIRLAVLNACEGARTSTTDPFAGAAQSLIRKGIPAVVAMQFEISDRAAIVFAHELYLAVSEGLPVDAALAEARRAIFGMGADVEWGTPVLHMRAIDGRLFDVTSPPRPLPVAPRPEPEPVPEHEPAPVPEPEPAPVPEPEPEPELVPEPEPELVPEPEPEPVPEREPVRRADPTPDPLPEPEPVSVPEPLPDRERGATPEARTTVPLRGILAAAGAVLLLFVWWMISNAADEPEDGDADATTTTVVAGRILHDSTEVVATRVSQPIVVDGQPDDWDQVGDAFTMRHVIHRSEVAERLGEDSDGVVLVAFDDQFLYLAAEVDDDVYSQMNVGDQIWRGDALTLNISTAEPGDVPSTPDPTEVQLTMTAHDADGEAAHAHFVGQPGDAGFVGATTDQPVDIAGVLNDDGSWGLEARIPWTVLGFGSAPSEEADVVALFAVFDNDGEDGPENPRQTVILANVESAGFQQPQTWGRLTLR